MASGDSVRDLLVQLRLDQSQYKREMTTAKQELTLLKEKFKEVDSDTELDSAGKTLRENVSSQIALLEQQVTAAEQQIEKLKAALGTVEKGSKEESALTKDLTAMETAASKAKAHINELKEKLEEMDAEAFVKAFEPILQLVQDFNMAFDLLVGDWAKETADSADEVFVAREHALAKVAKIAESRPGYYEGWDEHADAFINQLITEVPATYEEVALVMANAMQAGGVALEDIEEYTENFIRLEKSTDLTGEEGGQQFGKFLHIMEAGVEDFEALGSVIVALGNELPATESAILDTATRSASALRAVGISAEDVLGISASALSLGMEPAAAASALEKLVKKAGGSAEFAAEGYGKFREQVEESLGPFESFYDLQSQMDANPKVRKAALDALGMTGEDFDRMMRMAVQTEKFAGLMNQSVAEFAAAWKEDPAQYFADLFAMIGQLDESGASSLFETLAELGITEIREGRLASNFVMISGAMGESIALAREANKEATALEKESSRLFKTTESQRKMNQNKQENWMQKIGEGVTAVRQPWDDFFADLKQNLVENLPDWATTGFGAMVEVLSGFGTILGGVGEVAQGIYYTGQVYKDAKKIDWKNMGKTAKIIGKGSLAVGGAAAVVAALAVLGDALYQMAIDASTIVDNVANIQINVDEESKNRAIAAFEEVKNASQLTDDEKEYLEDVVNVVKAGYGDEEMFGDALGYAQRKYAEREKAIKMEYGTEIAEVNEEILAAVRAGDDALAEELTKRRDTLKESYEAEMEFAKGEYSAEIDAIVNGMIKGSSGAVDALEGLNGVVDDTVRALARVPGWQEAIFEGDKRAAAKEMLKKAEPAVEALMELESVGTMLKVLEESGVLGDIDYDMVTGNFASLMEAASFLADIKKARAQGKDDVESLSNLVTPWRRDKTGNKVLDEKAEEVTRKNVQEIIDYVLKDIGVPVGAVPLGTGIGSAAAQGLRDSKGEMVGAFGETLGALQEEANRMAPHIDAVVTWHVQGSAGAGATAGAAAGGIAGGITNNFNVTGSALGDRNNIKKLAQEIMRMQKQTNGSVGKV